MRIIAGDFKGFRLDAPNGMQTRPTADRVREAIFNVLASRVAESVVLDAFGGTGALALEAISRGAEKAVIIEKDRNALAAIASNIKTCGCDNQCRLLNGDTFKLLPHLQESFDLIFLDPPYAKDLVFPVLNLIFEHKLLVCDGMIILETAETTKLDFDSLPFNIKKETRYGDTKIIYCEKRR